MDDYWSSGNKLCRLLSKRQCIAKKEHVCWEHKGFILAGEEYVSMVGMWRFDDGGQSFKEVKYCLNCHEDWKEVLKLFHSNGQNEAVIVSEGLSGAIYSALENGLIRREHRLIRRWHTDQYKKSLIEAGKSEEDANYQITKEEAVDRGALRPFPGFFLG